MVIKYSITLLFFISQIVSAQQAYSLQDLINSALQKNADIQIANLDISIAELNQKKSVAGILPKFDAEGVYIYTTEKNGLPVYAGANGKNELIAMLSVQQTIFDPDVLYQFNAGSINNKRQRILNSESKQAVIQNVIDAYFTVLKFKNEKKILKENLEAFRLLYKQSKLLYETGTVPEIDVKKSKVEMLLQKNSLNEADKNYIAAYNYLKELIGLSFPDSLALTGFSVSKVFLDSLSVYQKSSWQNRPDWKLLENNQKLNRLRENTTFLKHLPILKGNLYYGWDVVEQPDRNNLGFQAAVTMSLPLWHWGSISADNQIAQIKTMQNNYISKKLRTQIMREIENAYNEAKLQKEQITAMLESKTESQLAVEMAKVGYQEGTITNLELINTQKLYTQSQMEYLKALYNFYLAKVSLFKSVGRLKEDMSWIEE